MSYGFNVARMWRRAAEMVANILSGITIPESLCAPTGLAHPPLTTLPPPQTRLIDTLGVLEGARLIHGADV